MLNEFGVPTEPPTEKVVDYDWKGEPIFDWDGEDYYKTDDGWVMNDLFEIREYMEHVWGKAYPIND